VTVLASPLIRRLLSHLLVPVAFVTALCAIGGWSEVFEQSPDEGFNVMKAFLWSEGYTMYDEIWSDQPPVFTALLRGWFAVFGKSVLAGRVLVLLLSAMLLWAFSRTLYSLAGFWPSVVGPLLLALSSQYAAVSVAILIGLPALTFATLAVYALVVYQTNHRRWLLLLSSGLMALSLHTKLFTAPLLPLFPVGLYFIEKETALAASAFRRAARSFGLWFGCLMAVYFLVGWLCSVNYLDQLLAPHFCQQTRIAYEDPLQLQYLESILWDHWDYALAAMGSLVLLVGRNRWQAVLPLVWLATVTLALIVHRPLRDHYTPLIIIPLCWGAALAVPVMMRSVRDWWNEAGSQRWGKLAVASLMLMLFVPAVARVPVRADEAARSLGHRPSIEWPQVRQDLSQYAAGTKWIFTDRPITAFYAGLRVPPEVAVFSHKRLLAGFFTPAEQLACLRRYKPEQVLLGRFQLDSLVLDHIDRCYTCINAGHEFRHYVRRPTPPPTLVALDEEESACNEP
jgi:hypothetical protein